MRLLTTESFRSLLTAHPAPCVSIFMPTERGPRASDQNRVRYEHLLQRARNDMHPFYSPRDIDPVLEPLARLPGTELWDAQHAGVAAFASRKFHLHFQLTDPPEELVIVGDSFHVRPLLAQLQTNRHYFLLNLNQKHAQLYRGTRRGLVPVELHGVAFEVASVAKVRERASTQHSGGAGFGVGIHHGQQGGDVGQREELQQYFREVDRAMQRELAFEKAPLVLAAPRELHTSYRMLSRYAHIAEEALHGTSTPPRRPSCTKKPGRSCSASWRSAKVTSWTTSARWRHTAAQARTWPRSPGAPFRVACASSSSPMASTCGAGSTATTARSSSRSKAGSSKATTCSTTSRRRCWRAEARCSRSSARGCRTARRRPRCCVGDQSLPNSIHRPIAMNAVATTLWSTASGT
jgi:hypothetical protein